MIKWKNDIEQSGIVMLKIEGDLTFAGLQPVLHKVEIMEADYPYGFNRFTDLNYIRHMMLTSDEIWNISQRRDLMYKGPSVKSAIYACNKFMYGMFRIYSSMMNSSPIDVDVFDDLDECAQWLEVPVDRLQVDRNDFETLCINQ